MLSRKSKLIAEECSKLLSKKDQLKIALIERHQMTGQIGLGIVKGLGIKSGAIATTVAHDSHNLIVCGENDQDMLVAASRVKLRHGGLIVVHQAIKHH